jgi:hypothetical protein
MLSVQVEVEFDSYEIMSSHPSFGSSPSVSEESLDDIEGGSVALSSAYPFCV